MSAGGRIYRKECERLEAQLSDTTEALRSVLGWYGLREVSDAMSKMGETANYHKTLNAAQKSVRAATNLLVTRAHLNSASFGEVVGLLLARGEEE